jgi:hypothetical protein
MKPTKKGKPIAAPAKKEKAIDYILICLLLKGAEIGIKKEKRAAIIV